LKTVDNIYRQRSAILERLDSIERDESALHSATEWYAMQHGLGATDARSAVAADLGVLRSQFDAIPRIVEEIDIRNARFSGAALSKIRYLLRQDRRTEGQLQFVIDALARGEAPDLDFEVYECELLDDGFLYTPPQQRQRPAPQPLARGPAADSEEVRRQAIARVRRLFVRHRIEAFVDELLAGRTEISLAEIPVGDDDGYVRLLYLASYGLDGDSSFRLVPSVERVRKGVYSHPDGRIERTRRRRGAAREYAGDASGFER
jgi:hypothetical protein